MIHDLFHVYLNRFEFHFLRLHIIKTKFPFSCITNVSLILPNRLEDLKVLRRSTDLLNNVKIGQGQLQLIMEQILFYNIWGLQAFWSSDLNNLMNNPSNSPVISEKQMFR